MMDNGIKLFDVEVWIDGKEKPNCFSYEDCICMGELIRNICVNLGIDPDTVNGITRNVEVYYKTGIEFQRLEYNPYESVNSYVSRSKLVLKIKKVT
jgi:hypothetical protein